MTTTTTTIKMGFDTIEINLVNAFIIGRDLAGKFIIPVWWVESASWLDNFKIRLHSDKLVCNLS